MKQTEFYCVSCRKRVNQKKEDICVTILKNKKVAGGVPALTGECRKCGTNLYKFIKRDSKERMIDKFGRC